MKKEANDESHYIMYYSTLMHTSIKFLVNAVSYMSKGELTPPIHWDQVMSHARFQNEHRY